MNKDKIKDLLKKVFAKDGLFVQSLQEILKDKPSFKDLFKGTFKDKLQVLVKGLATFVFVYEQKFEAQEGITREDLIDELAQYLDDQLELPWWAEMFDGVFFHFVIEYALKYVSAESRITTMYQTAFDEALAPAVDGTV